MRNQKRNHSNSIQHWLSSEVRNQTRNPHFKNVTIENQYSIGFDRRCVTIFCIVDIKSEELYATPLENR